MRFVTHHPSFLVESFRGNASRVSHFAEYLYQEITQAESDRYFLEQLWKESFRIYNTVPTSVTRDIPYINASNQVAPMAAEKADDIYSQILSAITALDPIVTVRATNAARVEHAKAIQKRLNLGVKSQHWNVIPALCEGLKDAIKLGTAVWVTHWTTEHKKTKFSRISASGPRIRAIPLEHVLAPAGAGGDVDALPWIAIFHEHTQSELADLKTKHPDWDIGPLITPHGRKELRLAREKMGQQTTNPTQERELYGLYELYCWYDIDGDGEEECLTVFYNLESRHIVEITYCAYDHFPLSKATFDLNEYLFYGKSVLTMLGSLNDLASDIINHWVDNGFLANTRMFKGKPGATDETTVSVWAGKFIASTDPASFDTIQLADIYPSFPLLFQLIDTLASRRVGMPSVNQTTEALGNRTPGITALSVLQNISQRHAAAFESIRRGFGHAVKQCLFREQEQMLMGNLDLKMELVKLLGPEDAALYEEALADPYFDDAMGIELTASSASINRESDKQDALMLSNHLLQFLPVMAQLTAQCGDPMAPEPLRMVCVKILTSLSEVLDNTVRTFEHIRNPEIIAVDAQQEASLMHQLANAQQMINMMTGQQSNGPMDSSTDPAARRNGQSQSPSQGMPR